jgi:NAD(P)-dependent dehydrogenase (short-subunit alcohol dehydrogenase family)
MLTTTRTALVTGGSRGLGHALAAALVARGWTTVVDGRDADRLAEAADELRAAAGTDATGRAGRAGRVNAVTGDVADPAHRAALRAAVEATGRLDLLVHNASELGPSPQPALADYPPAELERVYAVNVLAPLALTQLLLPLVRSSGGTIIMISSDAAVEPYAGWGGYGSSKAALDQIAAVLAAEEPGLRVLAFDPGDMRTEMHQRAFPGEDISDRPEPATVVPALLRLVDDVSLPSGRFRAADDLAALGATSAARS